MARVFVRLKLRLLAGAFRSGSTAVLLVLSAVFGLVFALSASGGLLAARSSDDARVECCRHPGILLSYEPHPLHHHRYP